ncbi:MAG TPA: hypothetical protein VHE78_14005, partial [Gemmatimonadaceae bacterium]|nr:hypothetical protein [Gemmatimonadaceae bacterium]
YDPAADTQASSASSIVRSADSNTSSPSSHASSARLVVVTVRDLQAIGYRVGHASSPIQPEHPNPLGAIVRFTSD